ncbi:hypothetical protein U0070_001425 [Myodes glareolus]|uniref:EGF-like domain-containing protein n=1 Tax=Myodes glareolus TaxID=447135 RepID=A0AAW0IHG5_MYOGA
MDEITKDSCNGTCHTSAKVGSLDAGLKGECKPYEGHGVSLKTSFALSTAAAFSIQTAKPRANVRQDSKGMEQSAQAGGAGSAEGLCGLRDPAGPQELVPATGAINACEVSNGGCSAKADCKRTTPGNRVCVCKAGYTGDGIVCLEINPCLENNGGCDKNAECTQTGPNQAVPDPKSLQTAPPSSSSQLPSLPIERLLSHAVLAKRLVTHLPREVQRLFAVLLEAYVQELALNPEVIRAIGSWTGTQCKKLDNLVLL